MRKIYAYIISLLVIFSPEILKAQDTIMFPLKIRAGIDLAGPAAYFTDKNIMSAEGYISVDRNEKMSYAVEGGYLNYKYSQYNYNYQSKGIFFRAGVDFNLLKPATSSGKYWAGIGLRYGISIFNAETGSFSYENYWGTVSSSVPLRTLTGHFIEVAPGMRTELFRNFSIGWTIRFRLLLSGGGGKDLPPIYFPGYGSGVKNTSAGINYYMVWSIPFHTKRIITRKAVEEEPEESEQMNNEQQPAVTGPVQ